MSDSWSPEFLQHKRTIPANALAHTRVAADHIAHGSTAGRPRARDLGIAPGALTPGPLNAITDVAGVRVGHVTLIEGDTRPHGRDRDPAARRQSVSGQGRRARCSSATRSASSPGPRRSRSSARSKRRSCSPTRSRSAPRWTRWSAGRSRSAGNENVRSVNALVGETNDGGAERHPRPARHARARARGDRPARRPAPVEKARSAPAPARWPSAGKAASAPRRGRCAGHGTSDTWTVGVLVQTNYGGKLVINGVPVWKELTPQRGASADHPA